MSGVKNEVLFLERTFYGIVIK